MTPAEQERHDAWASAGEERDERDTPVGPRRRVVHLYVDENPEIRDLLTEHPAMRRWLGLAGVDALHVHATAGAITATARGWSTPADEDADHDIAAQAVTVADGVLGDIPCPEGA